MRIEHVRSRALAQPHHRLHILRAPTVYQHDRSLLPIVRDFLPEPLQLAVSTHREHRIRHVVAPKHQLQRSKRAQRVHVRRGHVHEHGAVRAFIADRAIREICRSSRAFARAVRQSRVERIQNQMSIRRGRARRARGRARRVIAKRARAITHGNYSRPRAWRGARARVCGGMTVTCRWTRFKLNTLSAECMECETRERDDNLERWWC